MLLTSSKIQLTWCDKLKRVLFYIALTFLYLCQLMKKACLIILSLLLPLFVSEAKQKRDVPAPYAWSITQPLGIPYEVPMDTLMDGFYKSDVPSSYSAAYGTTGNLGTAAFNKIFFERPTTPEFIFKEPFSRWIQDASNWRFYNTRIPYTQLSYLTGGSKENAQDNLKATLSGNVNRRLEFGGHINYILARGYYQHQAAKDLSYSLFGSYMGDRYDAQFFLNSYNFVNQENGGLKNDDFILNPEEVQGGQSTVDTKTIPVRLNDAYNRVKGQDYYLTHRYKLGFYQEETVDTTVIRTFVPVTSIIHTISYNGNQHRFVNESATEDKEFFKNTYYNLKGTNDESQYWAINNTIGISLLEGFNKYAKMGLAAYITHEYAHYTLPDVTIPNGTNTEQLTPYPDVNIAPTYGEHRLLVGGELSKQKGKLLTYNVNAQFGILGDVLGSIDVNADVRSQFNLWKDSVQIRAYGFFKNIGASVFQEKYRSNHFIWDNNFGKIRRLRIGGELAIPRWGTRVNVGFENVQNYVYYNNDCLPRQDKDMIQVFHAQLNQNFKLGILHWDNEIIYQKSTKPSVIPLPELCINTNLYLQFRIAKVLHTQLGVDCNYYTKYKSEAFQPATLTFHTQDEIEVGDYPFMNVYANMKLYKVRFFVMVSHVNQGLFGGNNSFSLPHYPLNPRFFQFGLSIDFSN